MSPSPAPGLEPVRKKADDHPLSMFATGESNTTPVPPQRMIHNHISSPFERPNLGSMQPEQYSHSRNFDRNSSNVTSRIYGSQVNVSRQDLNQKYSNTKISSINQSSMNKQSNTLPSVQQQNNQTGYTTGSLAPTLQKNAQNHYSQRQMKPNEGSIGQNTQQGAPSYQQRYGGIRGQEQHNPGYQQPQRANDQSNLQNHTQQLIADPNHQQTQSYTKFSSIHNNANQLNQVPPNHQHILVGKQNLLQHNNPLDRNESDINNLSTIP